MTAIEIKAKEKELIKEINNDTNLLDSALKYIRRIKKKAATKQPCQFTSQEKETVLLKGEIDLKKGLGTSHKDFEKEFATW